MTARVAAATHALSLPSQRCCELKNPVTKCVDVRLCIETSAEENHGE